MEHNKFYMKKFTLYTCNRHSLPILEFNHLCISIKKIHVNHSNICPKSTAAGKAACLNAGQCFQLLRLHQRYSTRARPFLPFPEAQSGLIPYRNKRRPWQMCTALHTMQCKQHKIWHNYSLLNMYLPVLILVGQRDLLTVAVSEQSVRLRQLGWYL